MTEALLLPLFALTLWMSAIYADNKFRYFYEGKDFHALGRKSRGLRRFIILRNQQLKYVGLGTLWAGFSLGAVTAASPQATLSTTSYVIGVLGLLVYVVSRVWPFLAR